MARQAKCTTCHLRFVWDKNFNLKNHYYCPFCLNLLRPTTYQLRYEVCCDEPLSEDERMNYERSD
jgi:hypothetical protein